MAVALLQSSLTMVASTIAAKVKSVKAGKGLEIMLKVVLSGSDKSDKSFLRSFHRLIKKKDIIQDC